MKQFSFLIFLFSILSVTNAQTITTWQGPSVGGSWSDAANWNNGVPTAATTEIVFDGSVSTLTGGVITIEDVFQANANFSYDRLTVINNAAVTLSSSGPTYLYFFLSINIETGSRLNVGANTGTLFLVGGASTTAVINIDGILDLQGQGVGNSSRTGFEPYTSFTFNPIAKVKGQIILSGKVASISNSNNGNLSFESGSSLDIKRDGGSVPTAVYKNGSLIKVEGVINTTTLFSSDATYSGVIEWNCPGQLIKGSSTNILPNSSMFTGWDSLIINNTNAGTVRLATNLFDKYYVKNIIVNHGTLELGSPNLSSGSNFKGKVDTLIQTGGTIIGNAANAFSPDNAYVADTLEVGGKFVQTGGIFDFSNRTATADGSFVLKMLGDIQLGGTVKLSLPATSPNCALLFNGSGTQNFQITNTGIFSNKIKTVLNNSSPVTGVNATSNITLPDSLVFKKGYFILNNFDLTNPLPVLPVLNPFQTHVVTNSTGLFIQKNVTAAAVGIPIGATTTTVNPLIIGLTAAGVSDIGAKVDLGFSPSIASPNTAVNRTWRVKPFGVLPANLAISFGYSDLGAGMGDGNPGFSYVANDEVGLHDGTNWQVISLPGGIAPAGTNPYAISHIILNSFLAPNVATPLVIGNLTSVLSVSNVINLAAVRSGSGTVLKWDVTELTAAVSRFEILRSSDGRNFTAIGTTPVQGNLAYYSFADNSLLPGVNYYRIKMIDNNGRFKYSVIVTVINKESGMLLTALLPTIVNSQAALFISSATNASIQLNITDMQGRVVKRINSALFAGSNEVNLDCSNLAAGTYQVIGFGQGEKTNMIRFVKK